MPVNTLWRHCKISRLALIAAPPPVPYSYVQLGSLMTITALMRNRWSARKDELFLLLSHTCFHCNLNCLSTIVFSLFVYVNIPKKIDLWHQGSSMKASPGERHFSEQMTSLQRAPQVHHYVCMLQQPPVSKLPNNRAARVPSTAHWLQCICYLIHKDK